jgi:hypothetical protein
MRHFDIDKLLVNLRSIPDNMGVYPAAVKGRSAETSYEQRDGFKNGWNACIMEYGAKLDYAIDNACTELSSAERLFLADGDYYNFYYDQEDGWSIFLNDTWYFASADGERIPKEKYEEVASWYRKYGGAGVLYWVYLQRGHMPSILSSRRQVEMVMSIEDGELEERKSRYKGYLKWTFNGLEVKPKNSIYAAREVLHICTKKYGACPLDWDEVRYYIKDLNSWSYKYLKCPIRTYLRELTRKLYSYFY